jgi:Zn-dependent protease/CBS domain-containing protein
LGKSLRLTRIRNIDVKAHPTFLLALLWVIYYWGFAAGHGARGIVFGIFILIAAFVSVVGHELAHSFVALRLGLNVHDITLLPIGGVARIEYVSLTPRQEISIALAGPFLNLIVAGLLTPVVIGILIARDFGDWISTVFVLQETGFSALIAYLWLVNILLALFNLLPAFPMDGGRVMRAALSIMWGRLRATKMAVLLGHGLAVALILGGILLRDLSLPMVAVFILVAAYIEARMIHLESAMRTLPVGQFVLWDLGGVQPDSPLNYALRGGVRDVAVTVNGSVVGMLWQETVHPLLNTASKLRVREVMDTDVLTMDIDTSVYDVHRQMLATGRPAIPITEGGIYRGIFTSDRLVHVYRYLQSGKSARERYRSFVDALGLAGR